MSFSANRNPADPGKGGTFSHLWIFNIISKVQNMYHKECLYSSSFILVLIQTIFALDPFLLYCISNLIASFRIYFLIL